MITARSFFLSSRIALRTPPATLEAEIGSRATRALAGDLQRTAAYSIALLALAREVAERAAEAGISVVLLKGIALLGKWCPVGSRWLQDVDLLTAEDHGTSLQATLLRDGFRQLPSGGSRHQLPPLILDEVGVVEIHRYLPGVQIRDRRPAILDDLRYEGLCLPSLSCPGALRPRSDLLVAHCLAHGLWQHGESQATYSLLRMVADLLDLSGGEAHLAAEIESGRRWLSPRLPHREVGAVVELGRGLARGESHRLEGDALALLCHGLAGALDPRYRRRLWWRRVGRAVLHGKWRKFVSGLRVLVGGHDWG